MTKKLGFLFILCATTVSGKDVEPELPLCPTNVQYFPQNLPMHCRMPANAEKPTVREQQKQQRQTSPPFIPPYYQSPPPGTNMAPMPFPIPGLPGAPAMPMPMPMPLAPQGPAHKLPVIVMPFYSPDPAYKQQNNRQGNRFIEMHTRRPHHGKRKPYHDTDSSSDTDTDTDTDTETDTDTSSDTSGSSSSDVGFWRSSKGFRRNGRRFNRHHRSKRRRHNRREKDLLTPILQYVSKDGYVIFEKKISNGEAKQWLGDKGDKRNTLKETEDEYEYEPSTNNVLDEVRELKKKDNEEQMSRQATTKRSLRKRIQRSRSGNHKGLSHQLQIN